MQSIKKYASLPVLGWTLQIWLFLPSPTALGSTQKQGESLGSLLEALPAFLESTFGRIILICLFFAMIIGFLRLTYGPRGLFRDPRWDELNAEFKAEEQHKQAEWTKDTNRKMRRQLLEPLLTKEIKIFSGYVDKFCTGAPEVNSMYRLKAEHSLNVLKNAWFLVEEEESFADLRFAPTATGRVQVKDDFDKLLLLSALYHDLGRFEQLKRFHTFKDAESVNHAVLGSKLLAEQRFLQDASPRERSLIRTAVVIHNRLHMPRLLLPYLAPLCLALRDADKLDIMRIMAEELAPGRIPDPTVVMDMPDIPDSYSPVVLTAARQGLPVLFKDMTTVNDFRLLVCSWSNSLNFAASRRLAAANGHLESLLSGLPDTNEIAELRSLVMARLQQ